MKQDLDASVISEKLKTVATPHIRKKKQESNNIACVSCDFHLFHEIKTFLSRERTQTDHEGNKTATEWFTKLAVEFFTKGDHKDSLPISEVLECQQGSFHYFKRAERERVIINYQFLTKRFLLLKKSSSYNDSILRVDKYFVREHKAFSLAFVERYKMRKWESLA